MPMEARVRAKDKGKKRKHLVAEVEPEENAAFKPVHPSRGIGAALGPTTAEKLAEYEGFRPKGMKKAKEQQEEQEQ
jgi:hypothetical protein